MDKIDSSKTENTYNPLKSIPILVTGESSPTKIRSGSISSVSTELEDDAIFRKRWKSTYGFVLACIHLSLGLGNVWRFPYIAYRHGGGSFVIAYLVSTIFIIIPLYFMETSLGQFSSRGPLAVWVISPGFKGIGYAMLIISTLASMYFNMINSLSVLYTFASLQEKLPWEYCNNWWNTPDCVSIRFVRAINSNISMETFEKSVLSSSLSRRETLRRHKQFYYYYNQSPAIRSYVNRRGFLYDCVPSFLPAFNRTNITISDNLSNGTLSNFSLFSRLSSRQRNFVLPKQYIDAIIQELSAQPASSKKEFIKTRQNITDLLKKLQNLNVSSQDNNHTQQGVDVLLMKESLNETRTDITTTLNTLDLESERKNLFDPRIVVKFSEHESESIFANYSDNPILSTEEYLKVFLGKNSRSNVGLNWQMSLGSLFIWLIVFAVLIKGHKFSGKVAYVACLYPYILLIVIVIRVQSLYGSNPGIKKFFLPDKRIFTAEVWHDAIVQAFFSNFICWGPIIMMASHNAFFNNLLRDSLIVPCVNSFAALMIGVISFAMVSYISLNTCVPFDEIAPKDPSFIYVIYPVIMSTFPISPLWGFLLFATITQLGVNCQILCVKTLITSIMDEKIPHFNKPLRIIFVTSLTLFLFGLIFATRIGIYLIEFIDFETTAWSLLAIALLECIIVSWIYGANHLLLDIRIILRHPLRPLWYMAWSYLTPIILIIIIITSILDNRDIIMPYPSGFRRSRWISAIAWILSILPLSVIVGYFIYYFCARIKPALCRTRNHDVNQTENLSKHSLCCCNFYESHQNKGCANSFCGLKIIFENLGNFLRNCFKMNRAHVINESTNVQIHNPDLPARCLLSTQKENINYKMSGVEKIMTRNRFQPNITRERNMQKSTLKKTTDEHSNRVDLHSRVKFKTQPKKFLEENNKNRNKFSGSKLFFNKARNRLGIKNEPSSPFLVLSLKERLLKCIQATPEWGPYTENHQVLQQIAFRIQRSNHQILNKAVHKKAREIIDLVNASGSTNLSIKDLLFINPNAASIKSGEARLQNITGIGTSNKHKTPRKYSLFDGYKEVVFMELPKDMMTKIDEPGVYTFLQPLDINVPSNMILLPNISEGAIQNEQKKIKDHYDARNKRSMSQAFVPDFPVLSSEDVNLGPQYLNQSNEEDQNGFKDSKERSYSESLPQKTDSKALWRKLTIAAKMVHPQTHINDPSKHHNEINADDDPNKKDKNNLDSSYDRRRRGSEYVESKYLEADYPLQQFVFGRPVNETGPLESETDEFASSGQPTFLSQLRKHSRPSISYFERPSLPQQQQYITSHPLTHTKSIYPVSNDISFDTLYRRKRKSLFVVNPNNITSNIKSLSRDNSYSSFNALNVNNNMTSTRNLKHDHLTNEKNKDNGGDPLEYKMEKEKLDVEEFKRDE